MKKDLGLIDQRGQFDEQGWARYSRTLQLEATELENEIADRQPERDAAKAKLEKIFDHYAR